MKHATLNFIIDLISFIVFVGLAFSGFVIKFMPHGGGGQGQGFRGGRGPGEIRELWSISHQQWGELHFYLSFAFIALIVLHIILHWGWIKCYFKSLFGFGISRKTTIH